MENINKILTIMKKLEIKICTGTLCYVMGGAELQLIDEYIPEEIIERIDIKGTPCLDMCSKFDGPKAPFVKVGDRLVSDASVHRVIEVIKEELEKME